jgi:hypothetical protein
MAVRRVVEDPLLHGLGDTARLLRFEGSAAGHVECDGAAVLLETATGINLLARKGNCYTVAVPVSQFGVVSFPGWSRFLENALFFADDLLHIGLGPYVSFRIDDLPVTGESIRRRGYADWMGLAEIRAVQSAAAVTAPGSSTCCPRTS